MPRPIEQTAVRREPITFLQFVCEKLMGPPFKYGSEYGDAYWLCPFHGGDSFHTMPSLPKFKDRFHCFGCGQCGDEFDLTKHIMMVSYSYRKSLLEGSWRKEYEALVFVEPPKVKPPWFAAPVAERGPAASLLRGPRSAKRPSEKPRRSWEAYSTFRQRWEDVVDGPGPALEILEYAARCCRENNCTLDDLVTCHAQLQEHVQASDVLHRSDCKDSNCDADVCRIARGLGPMSYAERKALARRLRKQMQEQREALQAELKRILEDLTLKEWQL